jgi:hypothetical protein
MTEAQMQKMSVVEYINTPLTENIKKIWEKVRVALEETA